jgi:hypothetical protein
MSDYHDTIEARARAYAVYSSTKEGVIAGTVAASAVGICLVIIDLIAGRPFSTPGAWWSSVVSLFDLGWWAEIPGAALIGFTVMLYAVFFALGKTAAVIVNLARQDAGFRFMVILGFVLAQLMYIGFVAVVYDLSLGGVTTCVQLLMGSILGSALIGATLLREHLPLKHPRTLRRVREVAPREFSERLPTRSEY